MAYPSPVGVFRCAGQVHCRRNLSVQYGLAVQTYFGQAAGAVVLKTGVHSHLAAQGFPMQQVALDVADNVIVQVNLEQMSETIRQFVDGTSVQQELVAMQLPSLPY